MITQAESGLTTDQYDALVEEFGDATWKVIAHRHSLALDPLWTSPYVSNNDSDSFDAVLFDGVIYRVTTPNVLDWYDTVTDEVGHLTFGFISDINTRAGIVMALVDDTIHIYWSDTSRNTIYHASSDEPQNPMSWDMEDDTLTNVLDITRFAPAAFDRMHFVTVDPVRNLFRLHVATLSAGTWTTVDSEIYWTYPIISIDVEEYQGSDVIIMVSQIPGDLSVRADNGQVTKIMEPAGGIIDIKYTNGNWSDHIELDVVTNISAARYRSFAKVNILGDLLFVTGFAVDGTKEHTFGFYRYYKSSNGKHFSLGQALPFTVSSGSRGIKLIRYGDYVYGVENKIIYRSWSTLETGYSPTVNQLDITTYIDQYQISHDGALTATLTLSNKENVLADIEVLNGSCRTMLEHFAGYNIDGEQVMVKVAMTEVDVYDWSDEIPKRTLKLTARDALAWMSDRTQSDQSYYWENQLVGGDNYRDNTDTTYGGLRHTATQSGAWTTPNQTLSLAGSNKEGEVFSTFDPYIWNGGCQVQFWFSGLSNTEYAGLIFRAMDKDNFWFVTYALSTDKIYIGTRNSAINKVEAVTAGVMSFAGSPTIKRWLRVDFKYGKIIASVSIDGVSWTEILTAYAYGTAETPQPGTITSANLEKGYVGLAALGFGVEEVWQTPDYETSPILYEPIDYESPDFSWDLPVISTNVLTFEDIALTFNSLGKLARSKNFRTTSPIWEDILLPTDTLVKSMDWGWHSSFVTTGTGALEVWFLLESEPFPYGVDGLMQADTFIYVVRNMLLATPTFELMASGNRIVTPDWGSSVTVNRQIPGYVAGYWNHGGMIAYVTVTTDDGDTWNTYPTNPDGDVLVGSPNPDFQDSKAGFDFVGPMMFAGWRNTLNGGHNLARADAPGEDFAFTFGSPPISVEHPYLIKAAGMSGNMYVRAHQHTQNEGSLEDGFTSYWKAELWRIEDSTANPLRIIISPIINDLVEGDAVEISVCPTNANLVAVILDISRTGTYRLVYSTVKGDVWTFTPIVQPTTVFVSSARKVYYGTATEISSLGGSSKIGNLASEWGSIDTIKGILTLR